MDATAIRRYNDRVVAALVEGGWRLDERVGLLCECESSTCMDGIEVAIREHAARANTRWLFLSPGHADGPMRMIDRTERFVIAEPARSQPLQPLTTILDGDLITTAMFDSRHSWSLGSLVETNGPLIDMLGSLHAAATVVDTELRIVYVNDSGIAMSDVPREEVLGRTPSQVRGPNPHVERLERALGDALDSGHVRHFDAWDRREVGGARGAPYLDVSIQPIVDSDGDVIGACYIASEAATSSRSRDAIRAVGSVAREMLGTVPHGPLPDLLDRVALELVPGLVDGVAISFTLDDGPARLSVMRHRDEEVEAVMWRRDEVLHGLPTERVRRVVETGVPDVALVVQRPPAGHGTAGESRAARELARKAVVVSSAAVPIRVRSGVMGVMSMLTDGSSGRSLTRVEVDLLETVADLIGESIARRAVDTDLAVATWFDDGEGTHG
jgi:PAS domain-containing protein